MAWFKDTIDGILGEFHSIHGRLTAHAELKTKEADAHRITASNHNDRAYAASKEASRASTVAAKIGDLIK